MMNTLNTEKSAEKPFRKTGNPVELTSESPLHPRRKSHRIMVGSVPVGGGAPISVQSMTNTLTANVPATLQQIAELTAAGCDIVRVAVPSQDDADALPEICRKSPVPIIADIHFQSKYVFQAIDAGCAAVRVNPGNIRKFNEVGPSICKAATDAGISLRIGVNAGSLDKELYAKYGGPTPEALVASALKEAHMFEDVGFHDFKISVKHHDVITMVETYRLLASKGDWPLHLGVTEAGPAWQGTIKSCLAFGALLAEGIGDTIRVSLSAPPVEEVKVGCKLLEYMGLRPRKFDIISCPSCGRAQVDVIQLASAVTEGLKDVTAPIRVAVMGCIVNGPGEAREADLGVASGNGKGQIFIKGKVIETVPEDQIVDTLLTKRRKSPPKWRPMAWFPSTPPARWWFPFSIPIAECAPRHNYRGTATITFRATRRAASDREGQAVDQPPPAHGQSAHLHHADGRAGLYLQSHYRAMEYRAHRPIHGHAYR
ncbi:1-hydroxy-2-methyl-2-(E)-butenyl 4-diphosphate synthase [Bifidobacterium breve]|nr:1-hydroxy-2-methyl-2-(E)-butenyl 4-diphosphate synthase [Bifidobacterium breve]